jgi:hypothetical protein
MLMVSLDISDKKNLVSGKWGNSYTFTSNYEDHTLSMIVKDSKGNIIAKWLGKWVVKPMTPKDKRAARDVLEFLYYRNTVSQWLKTIS